MCGIVGILGKSAVANQVLDALKRLEYRGYDSAGVATLENGRLERRRAEGKLRNLELKAVARAPHRRDRHRPYPLGDARSPDRRPAAFLDRDGVLNLDTSYVHRADQLVWVEGAKRAVKHLNDAGFYVFVVTNQAGVAHGYYGSAEVEFLHSHMNKELRRAGAHVDAFEYCSFHPAGIVPEFRGASRRRKPEPGMIEDLLAAWPTVKNESFLIGDRETDLAAAAAASIQGFLFPGGNLEAFVNGLLAKR